MPTIIKVALVLNKKRWLLNNAMFNKIVVFYFQYVMCLMPRSIPDKLQYNMEIYIILYACIKVVYTLYCMPV